MNDESFRPFRPEAGPFDDGRFNEQAASLGERSPAAPLAAPARLATVCASSFAGAEVPPRPWLVKDMIPDRQVTMLGGDGGTGKSLLALQLGAAVATGTGWIGQMPEQGPVLYLSAEDDVD